MTSQSSSLRIVRAAQVLLSILLALSGWMAVAQEGVPQARRLDQFEDMKADDEEARLDNFAKELGKNPDLRGFIVGYRYKRSLPGQWLRHVYGFREYLVNSRGIDPDRIRVVNGGTTEKMITELWTLAPRANPPVPAVVTPSDPNSPTQFDQVSTTDRGGCVGEFTLELYNLRDALRFFAEALKENPGSKAWIVVHPSSRDSYVKADKTVRDSKESLVKDYGVQAERVLSAVGGRRSSICTLVNLWIVPPNSVKPDEAGYYSQLMEEAERNEYSVRRVEFVGNEQVRDNTLRRRFVQQEGNVFSRRALKQSLHNFSRLMTIYPVSLHDIDVNLDRQEKLMDLTIYFRERPHVSRASKTH